MLLLVFILLAVVLIMWAIYYVPMPPGSPVWIKHLLYVLVLLVAIIVIVSRLGVLEVPLR